MRFGPNAAKYHNTKVSQDGIQFDSKREHARYVELKLLERAGEIFKLKVHTKTKLVIEGRPVLIRSKGYPNGRQASYTDDFRYVELDSTRCEATVVVEDVKGMDTYPMRFKRAVFEAMTGIEVKLV